MRLHRGAAKPFGPLLKSARRAAGLTQRQLADLSTVSVRAIRNLELEHVRNPRRDTVRLLADGLQLSEVRRTELEESASGLVPGARLVDELPPPPAPLTPVIGRQHEVAALTELLRPTGHRLVSLVGVAGVGKTRLAQEVAGTLHRRSQLPVLWAHLGTPEVGPAAAALSGRITGLLRGERVLDSLAIALGDSELLLVVDGKDLKPGAETSMRLLLERCPGLKVLHESRDIAPERTGIEYPVQPLPVTEWHPDMAAGDVADQPALQLILSRCDRLHIHQATDRDAVAAIAGICWFLDGIPQAIEAAASWLLLFEPAQLLDIATRFPLRLSLTRSRTRDDLPTSLSQTLAGLPSEETDVLRRLAAAAEPWSLAQGVDLLAGTADDPLGLIYTLRSRGLIRPAYHDSPRFIVLNLVRHLLRDVAARMAHLSRPCTDPRRTGR